MLSGVALLILGAGTAPGQAPRWTVPYVEAGGGRVSYQETATISPLTSEWEASMFTLGGGVRSLPETGPGWLFDGYLGMGVSGTDEETWAQSGAVVQYNDLDWFRFDLGGDVGWYWPFERGWVAPTGWGVLRSDQYSRDHFVTDEGTLSTPPGSVDEDVGLVLFGAAVEGGVALDHAATWTLEGRLSAGWVAYSEASNSLLGDVEGNGGQLVDLSLALGWRSQSHSIWHAGIRYELQDLEGGTSVSETDDYMVEWPDNELEMFSLFFSWRTEI